MRKKCLPISGSRLGIQSWTVRALSPRAVPRRAESVDSMLILSMDMRPPPMDMSKIDFEVDEDAWLDRED